jgi:hypothetical protein
MIIPDHWFIRGAQSALFYYISCGPFSSFNARRRHRREARKDRKKKQAWAAARPDLYTHPAPREVNPYWREEMERGQKAAPPPAMAEPAPALVRGARGFGCNQRYRRPDEELEWEDDDEATRSIVLKQSALAVTGLDAATAVARDCPEYRAPAVNDQHPAIVSTVPQRAGDRRWMTLEPPSTAFLNGRKGVTVVAARSASAATTASSRTSPTLNYSSSVPSLLAPALVVTAGASPPRSPATTARGAAAHHHPFPSRSASPGSPVSRPDSAISNSRRRRGGSHKLLRPPRLHLSRAFADGDGAGDDREDEHADDEDDSDCAGRLNAPRRHSARHGSYAGRYGGASSASNLGDGAASEFFQDRFDDLSDDGEARRARPVPAARRARLLAPAPEAAVQRTRSAAGPAAKRAAVAPPRARRHGSTGSATASSGDGGTSESVAGRRRRRRRRGGAGDGASYDDDGGEEDDGDGWWGEREVARWAGMGERLARERLWLGEPGARARAPVGAAVAPGGEPRRWSTEY